MTITYTAYSTEALLGVYRDLEPIQDFWLQMFPGVFQSTEEEIQFNKITDYRHLAPFVLPTAQGRPIYKANENIQSVKPGYLKPKDAIQAAGMIRRRAGLGELGAAPALSPQGRWNASVTAVAQTHNSTIQRRWEWMAAQAALYGEVTLVDDGYPSAVVNFRRDPGHDVTLGSGARWGESGVEPLDDLEGWIDIMARAKFGGAPTNLIMGTLAWTPFRQNQRVLDLLNTQQRQTSGTTLNLGVGDGTTYQYKGMLNQNVSIYVYNDYYEAADGTMVQFMDQRDIFMVGPNFMGVKAFGAILDKGANFQPLPIFPKMWDEEDPSATILMSQSAPLPFPVNPNASFRARVVA